jgi:RimJ/RimL family protein N-acetyltransferase
MEVRPIETERLELVRLTAEAMEASLSGDHGALPYAVPADWPDVHDTRLLQLRLRQLLGDPSRVTWGVYAIVLGGEMVGHIGFHGPPGVNARRDPDAVEIGYTVFPEHRRRGYATEAVRGLLAYAREHGVRSFVASVGPGNEPSLRLVRGLGFVEVGRHWDDEDGEELELVLDDPPTG